MYDSITTGESLIVAIPTLLFGLNGYIVRTVFALQGGFLNTGVPIATIMGCGLGAFIGEGLSQAIFGSKSSGRGKMILMAMTKVGTAALVVAGGASLVINLTGATAGNEFIVCSLSALGAVIAASKVGLTDFY